MPTAEASDSGSNGVDTESLAARQADALVDVARAFLSGGAERTVTTADHYQVVVHVDEAALRNAPAGGAKSDLPLESIRRLCCDTSMVTVTEDDRGNPLDVGRKHRLVQPALRRALLQAPPPAARGRLSHQDQSSG